MSRFDPIIEQMIARRTQDVLALITAGKPKAEALAQVFAQSILGRDAKHEVADRVHNHLRGIKS